MALELFQSAGRVIPMATTKRPVAQLLFTSLCWFRGGYYFLTGVWPLVSIRTFKMVTGEKTDNLPTGLDSDHWLVMAVSLLITAISITLLLAAYRRTLAVEIAALAMLAACGLTAIDVIYTARQVILPIYLLDAAVEVPLVVAWCVVLYLRGAPSPSSRQKAN
jgi:hypothetical protein